MEICAICSLNRPPLLPMSVEHRRLLEAVVSPILKSVDLEAYHLLLCMECQAKMLSVQQFQVVALNGVRNLKYLLRKENAESNTVQNNAGCKDPLLVADMEPEIIKSEPTPDEVCDQEHQGNENTDNHEITIQLTSAERSKYDQVLANQNIISEKIDNMLQMQATTLENQQKFMQFGRKEVPSGTLKDANFDTESFTLNPIDNHRDLISLEQLLTDRAEKIKLQRHLSFLCSASKGEGVTCAYKLQDTLFTKDFLCSCSWTGGSRGETSKIAIKDYKNVLNFFHGMIQTWDPTYTVQDNEKFFKIITRNSNKRKTMKNLRMSSQRCRKNKGLNKQKCGIKKQANYEDEIDGIINQTQEYVPSDNSKETGGGNMEIQEYAFNNEA